MFKFSGIVKTAKVDPNNPPKGEEWKGVGIAALAAGGLVGAAHITPNVIARARTITKLKDLGQKAPVGGPTKTRFSNFINLFTKFKDQRFGLAEQKRWNYGDPINKITKEQSDSVLDHYNKIKARQGKDSAQQAIKKKYGINMNPPDVKATNMNQVFKDELRVKKAFFQYLNKEASIHSNQQIQSIAGTYLLNQLPDNYNDWPFASFKKKAPGA